MSPLLFMHDAAIAHFEAMKIGLEIRAMYMQFFNQAMLTYMVFFFLTLPFVFVKKLERVCFGVMLGVFPFMLILEFLKPY